MTDGVRLQGVPGNVLLPKASAGLPRESVVNVSQLVAIDRRRLLERVGSLSASQLRDLNDGVRLVLAL